MEQLKKLEIYLDEKAGLEHVNDYTMSYEKLKHTNPEIYGEFHNNWNEIGSYLINFIYYLNGGDSKYAIIREDGFQTLLTNNERQELLPYYNDNEILDKKTSEIYTKYERKLKTYRKQIINILEYCIFNEDKKLKNLSPIQRLTIFINEHPEKDYSILNYNRFTTTLKFPLDKPVKEKSQYSTSEKYPNYLIQEVYEFDNYYNLLVFELMNIIRGKIHLKKCKNCGKYFVTNNYGVTYCRNFYEGDKTCRDIGASRVFIKNLEKDEAYNLYRKIYKRKQAIAKSKGGKYYDEYIYFRFKGKEMKDGYKLEEITKEEFIEWLNEQ